MQYLKLSQLVEMVKELETAAPNSNNLGDVENRLSQADMWIERFAGNEDFFEHPLIIKDLFTLAKLTGDRDNPYTALWEAQDHNTFAKLKEKWPNLKTALLQEIMYCKEWNEIKMVRHYPEIKRLAEIAARPISDPSEQKVLIAKRTCYINTIDKVRQLAPDIFAAVDEDLKGKFTELKLGRYNNTDEAKCADGYCYDIMGYKGSDLSKLISGRSRRRRLIFGYEKKTGDYFLNKQFRSMALHDDVYCDFGGHLCDIVKNLGKQVNRPNFFEAFLCVFLFVALRNELREVENVLEAYGWLPPQGDGAKLKVVNNSMEKEKGTKSSKDSIDYPEPIMRIFKNDTNEIAGFLAKCKNNPNARSIVELYKEMGKVNKALDISIERAKTALYDWLKTNNAIRGGLSNLIKAFSR